MLSLSRASSVATRPRRSVATHATAHEATAQKTYYVAMNVFKVKPESAADFEQVWRTRESYLKNMPGFVRFAMLRCENVSGKYVSQSYWESKEAFQAWTQSSQFAASHGSSSSSGGGHGQGGASGGGSQRPNTMSMLEGPPSPEFFSSVTITE